MTEDPRTYHTAGGEQFDHITAIVVAGPPSLFTPHTGEQVFVRAEFPYPSVPPALPQVLRIAQVAGVADGFGTMLTFTDPLVIPRAPRLPRFTVCDMEGNEIK